MKLSRGGNAANLPCWQTGDPPPVWRITSYGKVVAACLCGAFSRYSPVGKERATEGRPFPVGRGLLAARRQSLTPRFDRPHVVFTAACSAVSGTAASTLRSPPAER